MGALNCNITPSEQDIFLTDYPFLLSKNNTQIIKIFINKNIKLTKKSKTINNKNAQIYNSKNYIILSCNKYISYKGNFTYTNSNDYDFIVDDKPAVIYGYGVVKYPNNFKFKGYFKDGVANGFGQISQNKEIIFNGNFKDDMANGNCCFNSIEYKYTGSYDNGIKSGIGEYICKVNNYKYKGSFSNNKFNYKGELVLENGYKYKGDFKDSKFDGFGKIYHNNNKIFEGQFKDHKKEGKGTVYFGDIKYEGFWRDGIETSNCKFLENEKTVLNGEWKDINLSIIRNN